MSPHPRARTARPPALSAASLSAPQPAPGAREGRARGCPLCPAAALPGCPTRRTTRCLPFPTFLPPAVLPVYSTGKGLEASGVSQDSLMKYTLSNIQQGSSVLWCAAATCHASAHLPAPPGLPPGPARAYPHARTPCSACSAG